MKQPPPTKQPTKIPPLPQIPPIPNSEREMTVCAVSESDRSIAVDHHRHPSPIDSKDTIEREKIRRTQPYPEFGADLLDQKERKQGGGGTRL